MSTIERKEYQETKVMRTVSPVRNIRGSTQNLAEFDNNLDYLLEDLQNSVSRPGSSLGTYREHSKTLDSSLRSNSLNRFNNVKSSNPVEYSSDDAYNYTSPDGSKRVTGYKKESYSYKTSGASSQPENGRMKNSSINQLDSLLDDLQQVKSKSSSSYLEKESYNNTGADPDFHGNSSSRRAVHRELHYGDTPRSSSRTRTLDRTDRESSLTRDTQYTNEGTYGDLRPIRGPSPSPSSRTSTLSKQTKVTNVHSYPVEVVETTTPDINPEILAHLDPNLHPPGNTKVTTTIKTYTYEIPGSGSYPTNLDGSLDTTTSTDKYVYSPNQSESIPSKSFVYKKIENKSAENTLNYGQSDPGWHNKVYKETTTSDRTNYQPPYQKPTPPSGYTTVKETITTRNYQPEVIPTTNQSYVYNETTTTRNIDDIPRGSGRKPAYPNDYPRGNPPRQETYLINEIHDRNTTNTVKYPEPSRDYPPGNQTHYIKEIHDTNTTRNVHHPPQHTNGYPPNDKTVIYRHETHTTNNYGGPGNKPRPGDVESFDPKRPPYDNHGRPKEPVNIQYRYKSESTTTNNYKTGYPPSDETQALLPNRFPTEGPDGPPKKLDELMATIGHEPPNSPYNASYNAHEQDMVNQRKIDTLKRQHEDAENTQKKEPLQKSKNVTGPPVYYPPGHEMFSKKEEAGGWEAKGGYEKASGKYKYEAESRSKSKSSSGAAVVPVCLPLCCGLPCTII